MALLDDIMTGGGGNTPESDPSNDSLYQSLVFGTGPSNAAQPVSEPTYDPTGLLAILGAPSGSRPSPKDDQIIRNFYKRKERAKKGQPATQAAQSSSVPSTEEITAQTNAFYAQKRKEADQRKLTEPLPFGSPPVVKSDNTVEGGVFPDPVAAGQALQDLAKYPSSMSLKDIKDARRKEGLEKQAAKAAINASNNNNIGEKLLGYTRASLLYLGTTGDAQAGVVRGLYGATDFFGIPSALGGKEREKDLSLLSTGNETADKVIDIGTNVTRFIAETKAVGSVVKNAVGIGGTVGNVAGKIASSPSAMGAVEFAAPTLPGESIKVGTGQETLGQGATHVLGSALLGYTLPVAPILGNEAKAAVQEATGSTLKAGTAKALTELATAAGIGGSEAAITGGDPKEGALTMAAFHASSLLPKKSAEFQTFRVQDKQGVKNLTEDARSVLTELDGVLGEHFDRLVITSGKRHGKEKSYHNSGEAVDIAGASRKDLQAAAEILKSKGYRAQFEFKGQKNKNGSVATGDHVHVTLIRPEGAAPPTEATTGSADAEQSIIPPPELPKIDGVEPVQEPTQSTPEPAQSYEPRFQMGDRVVTPEGVEAEVTSVSSPEVVPGVREHAYKLNGGEEFIPETALRTPEEFSQPKLTNAEITNATTPISERPSESLQPGRVTEGIREERQSEQYPSEGQGPRREDYATDRIGDPAQEPAGLSSAERPFETANREAERTISAEAPTETLRDTTGEEAQVQQVETTGVPVDRISSISFDVKSIPLRDLKTHPDLQNRNTAFSEESVQNIAAGFDANKLDPIVVFKDPTTGDIFTANHSRPEAFRRLGKEEIPARQFQGTWKEFVAYSKSSNNLGTPETLIERAKLYRNLRSEGESDRAIERQAQAYEKKNWKSVVALSYLDPTSKPYETIVQFERTGSPSDVRLVHTMGEWVGEAAKDYGLSKTHQNELFDYLQTKLYKSNGLARNKNEFLDNVGQTVNTLTSFGEFAPEQRLNFGSDRTTGSVTERAIRQEVLDKQKEIRSLRDERAAKVLELESSPAFSKLPPEVLNKRMKDALAKYDMSIERAKTELRQLQVSASSRLKQARESEPELFMAKRFTRSVKIGTPKDRAMNGEPPIKSKQQVIRDLSKGLNIPIRFGRLIKKVGGYFNERSNLIATHKADLVTVTHEVGHKLDSLFHMREVPEIREELMHLGDNVRDDSMSSWNKERGNDYRLGEGVAEFFRYYLTEAETAKRLAPRTSEYLDFLFEKNPDIANVIKTAADDVQRWREAPSSARINSAISIGENPAKVRFSARQLIKDVWDNIQVLEAIRDEVNENRRKGGEGKLLPSNDPYVMARLYKGTEGIADTFLNHGVIDYTTNKVSGEGFKDIMKPVADRLDDFRIYMVARRAKELHGRNIETGLDRADVETSLSELKDPVFEQTFDKVQKWNDGLLQYAADAGLISPDALGKMKMMNQDYVPFHRLFEVGAGEMPQTGGGSGRGLNSVAKPDSFKKLRGSDREIVDPLEGFMKNAHQIISAANKNAVNIAIAGLAKEPGMGRWVEEIAPPKEFQQVNTDLIKKQLEELGADVSTMDDGVVSFYKTASFVPNENIIKVTREGQSSFYRVDPELYRALKGLDAESAGLLTKVFGQFAQILRSGVTDDPSFVVSNAFKDTLGASVVAREKFIPFYTTAKGVGILFKRPDLVREWAASGGMNSFESIFYDRSDMQRYLKQKIKGEMTPLQQSLVWLDSPLRLLRLLSAASEKWTRLGYYESAYNAALKRGMSEKDAKLHAAFESRDLQDFAMGGERTKALKRISAFFGADLNAKYRLYKAFKENPLGTTTRGFLYLTLPSIALYMKNRDDKQYWERPQWERDHFWHIFKVDSERNLWFILPKPFELGTIFSTIPERMLAWMDGKDKRSTDGLLQLLSSQLVPLPTANVMVPIMEVNAGPNGWDWFKNQPIVPKGMEYLPPEFQYTEQNSLTARNIGRLIGVSPAKVDHLISRTTGTVGKTIVSQAVDRIIALGTGEERTAKEVVPFSRFISTGGLSESVNQFHEEVSKLRQLKQRASITGKLEQADALSKLDEMEVAAKEIQTLRRMLSKTKDEEKRMNYRYRMVELAQQFTEPASGKLEPPEGYNPSEVMIDVDLFKANRKIQQRENRAKLKELIR